MDRSGYEPGLIHRLYVHENGEMCASNSSGYFALIFNGFLFVKKAFCVENIMYFYSRQLCALRQSRLCRIAHTHYFYFLHTLKCFVMVNDLNIA